MCILLDFRTHGRTGFWYGHEHAAIYLPKSSDMFMRIVMCILHDLVYYLSKSCNMLISMFMSILHDFVIYQHDYERTGFGIRPIQTGSDSTKRREFSIFNDI